jgi:hypothetical protein
MPDDIAPEETKSGNGAPTRPGSRSIGRRSTRTNKALTRTGRGGAAPIIAGVAIIAPILIAELTARDPFLMMPLSLILVVFGLAGLRAAQAGGDGVLGRIGFLISAAGGLFLAAVLALMKYNELVLNTRLRNAVSLISIGFFILLIGVVVFGAAMVMAGRLNRLAAVVLMLSIPVGLAIDRFSMLTGPGIRLEPGFRVGVKIFGLALIWLGYSIISKPKPEPQARTVTS